MSTPVPTKKTEQAKVKMLREFRNRRLSVSEPESPIPTRLQKKTKRKVLHLEERIPKKYRLSLESPFEDFKLVSPKTSICKNKFPFVGDSEKNPLGNPLPLPPQKPLRPLAYVIKK
jgi:hypothetical protein